MSGDIDQKRRQVVKALTSGTGILALSGRAVAKRSRDQSSSRDDEEGQGSEITITPQALTDASASFAKTTVEPYEKNTIQGTWSTESLLPGNQYTLDVYLDGDSTCSPYWISTDIDNQYVTKNWEWEKTPDNVPVTSDHVHHWRAKITMSDYFGTQLELDAQFDAYGGGWTYGAVGARQGDDPHQSDFSQARFYIES